jgi:hypothetical protein
LIFGLISLPYILYLIILFIFLVQTDGFRGRLVEVKEEHENRQKAFPKGKEATGSVIIVCIHAARLRFPLLNIESHAQFVSNYE